MQNGPANSGNNNKSIDWLTGWHAPSGSDAPLPIWMKPTINLNCFAFSYATLRSFCWLTGNRNPTKGNNGNKNCRFVTAIVVVAVRPIFWFIRFFFSWFFCQHRVAVITFYGGYFYLFLKVFVLGLPFIFCSVLKLSRPNVYAWLNA